MPTYEFSATAVIQARPQELYAIIADYHHGHPQIIPKPPFVSLEVEEGGIGAGTVVLVFMRMLGQNQTLRGVVTEPEPGRVLVETYDTGSATTFIVDPHPDGQQATVTILTVMVKRPGLGGLLESWFVPRFLRPVYVRELAQLGQVAQTQWRP